MTDITTSTPLTLTIERLNPYGFGVARLGHLKYHIPFVLVGEQVTALPVKKRRDTVICKLVTIIKASPDRVLAPCSRFGVCGGCNLQHMTYAAQLQLKEKWLQEIFVYFTTTTIHPIIASPHEFNYRNRVTLHHDGKNFGFHTSFTHDIVTITECPIASPTLNQKIAALSTSVLSGPSEFELRDDDEAENFVQVNSEQNTNLISCVTKLCHGRKSQRVLELYSGQGNLSFALADIAREVIAVEGAQTAVKRAEERRIAMGVKNLTFFCRDVYADVFARVEDCQNFTTIVCDPPRGGLQTVAGLLPRLQPKKIVYVSCDPHTLVRDAGTLTSKGYALKTLSPLDMFPQTHHIEVVAVFEKLSVV